MPVNNSKGEHWFTKLDLGGILAFDCCWLLP